MKLHPQDAAVVEQLKLRAKVMRNVLKCPHHQALNSVAKEYGYTAWTHLMASAQENGLPALEVSLNRQSIRELYEQHRIA